MAELTAERPERPAAFLIECLAKNYPSESEQSLHRIHRRIFGDEGEFQNKYRIVNFVNPVGSPPAMDADSKANAEEKSSDQDDPTVEWTTDLEELPLGNLENNVDNNNLTGADASLLSSTNDELFPLLAANGASHSLHTDTEAEAEAESEGSIPLENPLDNVEMDGDDVATIVRDTEVVELSEEKKSTAGEDLFVGSEEMFTDNATESGHLLADYETGMLMVASDKGQHVEVGELKGDLLMTVVEDGVKNAAEYCEHPSLQDDFPKSIAENSQYDQISELREESLLCKDQSATASIDCSESGSDEDDVSTLRIYNRLRTRRGAISSATYSDELVAGILSGQSHHQKTKKVKKLIRKVVHRIHILKNLSVLASEVILDAFQGPQIIQPGETIIRQGEAGDRFYVIVDGSVDVFISNDDQESLLHTYKSGQGFGQLALLYDAPRAATCKGGHSAVENISIDESVSEQCSLPIGGATLWYIDRKLFQCLLIDVHSRQRARKCEFLLVVNLFQLLSMAELWTLSDSIHEMLYRDGQYVCHQGDDSSDMNIITSGTAVCSVFDADGNESDIAMLSSGHFIGEASFMSRKPRQASVRASGELKLLSISADMFSNLLGSPESILQRDQDSFQKYILSNL